MAMLKFTWPSYKILHEWARHAWKLIDFHEFDDGRRMVDHLLISVERSRSGPWIPSHWHLPALLKRFLLDGHIGNAPSVLVTIDLSKPAWIAPACRAARRQYDPELEPGRLPTEPWAYQDSEGIWCVRCICSAIAWKSARARDTIYGQYLWMVRSGKWQANPRGCLHLLEGWWGCSPDTIWRQLRLARRPSILTRRPKTRGFKPVK